MEGLALMEAHHFGVCEAAITCHLVSNPLYVIRISILHNLYKLF
jgi:hypothetical protein